MSDLRELGWEQWITWAASRSLTEPGRIRVESWLDPACWTTSVEESQILQLQTQEVLAVLGREGLWSPLRELPAPFEVFPILERNGVLGLSQLQILRRWCLALETWNQFPQEELGAKWLRAEVRALFDPYEILRWLHPIFTPNGELSDRASPKLQSITSQLRDLRAEVRNVLQELVQRFSEQGVLQDRFTDVREDRFVLPVKSSSQHDVVGRIIDASVSKQTVYIEPQEIGARTTRLKQLEAEREEEIYRILSELSRKIAPHGEELERSIESLVTLDAVQSRAQLARETGARAIRVQRSRRLKLTDFAHPILFLSLKESEVVRNSVEMNEDQQMILISGPNTGGKTVLLKAIGMAAACARTGFFFSTREEADVPFFDRLFIDVGDSQSIGEHISSFSGHIKTLKHVLETVTPESLVLLDELNSATDPEEGAALSRAILEALFDVGVEQHPLIIATTHDPSLKALGLQDTRILSASMSFEESTEMPTYKMQFGMPGRSRALATARRLGIPAAVLERAQSYLSQKHSLFEQALSELQTRADGAKAAFREAEHLRAEAEKLKADWTEKTSRALEDVLERSKKRLRQTLEQAEDEVRSRVRKFEETQTRKEVRVQSVDLRDALRTSAERTEAKIQQVLQEESPDFVEMLRARSEVPVKLTSEFAPPKVGDVVRLPKWKSLGTIIEMRSEKLKVSLGLPHQAKSGLLTTWVQSGEFEQLSESEVRQALGAQGMVGRKSAVSREEVSYSSIPEKLDLRGKRFEDAMQELERYLDRALRAGRREVTIVHGLGTGVLREGTIALLRGLPYVAAFREGGQGGGGTGATKVELSGG